MKSFAEWLTHNGWERDGLTPTQLTTLQACWRAEQSGAAPRSQTIDGTVDDQGNCTCQVPDSTPPADPAADPNAPGSYAALMASFRRDQDREREITALAASALKDHPGQHEKIDQIAKLALAGRWSAKDTELALLRGLRAEAPSPLSRGGREVSPRVLEAALAVSAGLNEERLVKAYGERTMEEAHTAFRGGLSLSELILRSARVNGHRADSLRTGTKATLRAAFAQPMSVGFSNVSLPGILSNVANKSIREGFDYVDQSWKEVTAFRNTNDFKEVTTYGLLGDYDFVELAKDGKIQHAVPGELSYGNKVSLYARMMTLTYVDLINDDLGAFNQKGKKLGGGAGRKLAKVFWTEWNNLTNFNTADNGNYAAGSGTAFSSTALETATQMFRAQRIPESDSADSAEPLGVRPRLLVVSSSVERPALRLMRSEKVMEDSVDGEQNVWANAYKVVAPDYMEEETYGGVNTQWHLIADPNELPCIETAFLFGQQAPTIEDVDVDADQLGVGMRGYWAFGVRRQESRARVTMKGKA